jgi:hypothetical protein
MKLQTFIKLVVLGALIVVIFQLLRGHDVLTGIALVLLFLVALTKLIFAVIHRRRRGPSSGGGGWAAGTREPRPPGGRPPVLSAAAKME